MKKLNYFAAIIAASLTLASCGFGTTAPATTTTNTNTAATTGNILGDVLGQTGGGLLGTVLGSLLGNTTSQQSLVGTWTYYGPKVVFESENILSQLGGQVVSNSLEQKLGTQLQKMGFKPGKSALVLNSDNSCTLALGTQSWPGTYTYDASTNKMTLTGVLGLAQLTCTVSVQAGQLYMLFEADKLLSVATSVSAKTASSLSSLLQSYSGLKLGWTMTK